MNRVSEAKQPVRRSGRSNIRRRRRRSKRLAESYQHGETNVAEYVLNAGRPRPLAASSVIFDLRRAVFVCYAHEDNDHAEPKHRWCDRFLQFVRPLVRQENLTVWSDREIAIGDDWHQSIVQQLSVATGIVLLISPAFLASDYIATHEIPILLHRAHEHGARLLPILISPCMFEQARFKYPDATNGPHEFSLSSILSANTPAKTLVEMAEGEQNRVLLKVAKELAALV